MRTFLVALGIGLIFIGKVILGFFHVIFISVYQSTLRVDEEVRRDLKKMRSQINSGHSDFL